MVAVRPRSGFRGSVFGSLVAPSTLEPPPRRDALPEHTRYADTGCSIHPSCLSCPLVRCRYDEPRGVRAITGRDRDLSVLRIRREESLTVEAVASRFGISRRTVFRILARARDGDAAGNGGGEQQW